ncbi:MAG: carboxypeptidase-like regulatory domain-containing protein, partial [Bacteroidales bacterium]
MKVNSIQLFKRAVSHSLLAAGCLLMFSYSLQAETNPEVKGATMQQAQSKTISGKVIDTNGQPIPGATIVIKGTTQGTLTDMDGKFTISNLPPNAVLFFSFVGMKTVEQAVGNQKSLKITLQNESLGLEEVVA